MGRTTFKKALFATTLTVAACSMLTAGGCSSPTETMDAGIDTGLPDTMSGDAPTDTKVKDTTPPDNQAMCPTPKPLGMNFMPPAYVPPHPAQSVCSSGQIQGFWDNCRNLGMSTQQTCTTWQGANAACNTCLFSMQGDSSWGAMIYRNGISFVNTAGCLDLLGDKTCAQANEALAACEAAACDTMCTVTDFFAADHAATLMDWQKCSSTVTMGGDCQSFVNAVNMKCNVDAGSAACFGVQGDDFKSLFFKLAPIFCTSGG